MKPSEKQKQINLENEKKDFQEREKAKSARLREERLDEHKEHLRQQMFLRSDYYQLTWLQKLMILLNIGLLFGFIVLFFLSHFMETKNLVFNFINKLL